MTYQWEGELPGMGYVYFNENSIANILSFALVEDAGFDITYCDGSFYVRNPKSDKTIKFNRMSSRLYAHDITNKAQVLHHKGGATLLETVEENKSLYTARDFKKAKQARDVYEMIGTPSNTDYKGICKYNLIKNLEVSVKDIDTATDIFGKDLGAVQGKSTWKKSKPVVIDYVEIPEDILKKNKKVVVAVDIMYMNEILFLITISRTIKYITGEVLKNRSTGTLLEGLLKVFSLYQSRGFEVTT